MTTTALGVPFPVATYAATLPPHRRDSFAVFTREASPEALTDFLRTRSVFLQKSEAA
jgi:hypothetical protein